MDHVSNEIRRQTLQHYWKGVFQSKFAIGFLLAIVIVLSWNVYKSSDSVVTSEIVSGKVLGVHQIQGNTGSTVSMLVVQLNDGKTVMVIKPLGVVAKPGKMANLSKESTKQDSIYYHFIDYLQLSQDEFY